MTEIEQKQQFARDSYKAIRNILYKEHGIDNDNLARYMTLQVLQETEWGKKPSGKNNYFGIKAKNNEPFTSVLTTEYIDGKKTMLKQNFRDYDSLEDGYSSFVKNLVTNYDIKNHAKSLNDYTSHVAKKYATDPEYANKLSGIYNGRTFKQAMDGYYIELPRKFAKPSYTPVEQPDALRVSKLEPYIPISYTPKPNPIQDNFWKAWSQMPYKQQGGTIMNETIKKFKQIRKAQKGIKVAPKASKRFKGATKFQFISNNDRVRQVLAPRTSALSLIHPAMIEQGISQDGQDTTYAEFAPHASWVTVNPRVAKSDDNSQEYKTLKRRFSEASRAASNGTFSAWHFPKWTPIFQRFESSK